jgi:hypothetical protein
MYGVSELSHPIEYYDGSSILSELWPLGPRLLPHGPLVPIAAEQMTVERCLDGCAAAGYNAAALEAGQVTCFPFEQQFS